MGDDIKQVQTFLTQEGYLLNDEPRKGGNSWVFWDKNKNVAIKVLRRTDHKRPERFREEINKTKDLQGGISGIVPIQIPNKEEGKYLYFTMPYYINGTLGDFLKKMEKRPVVDGGFDAVSKILEVSRIIKEIHTKNYAHRDLKPDNILLDNKNNCLVADFGLCIDLDKDFRDRKTGDEELVGSVLYRAPEFLRGRLDKTNHRPADIFSLGRMLWSLLTGDEPYCITDLEFQESCVDEIVAGLHRPSVLREIIWGATAFDPYKRLNINEFMLALEDWQKEDRLIVLDCLEEKVKSKSTYLEYRRWYGSCRAHSELIDTVNRFVCGLFNGLALQWNEKVTNLMEGKPAGSQYATVQDHISDYPHSFRGVFLDVSGRVMLRLNFCSPRVLPCMVAVFSFKILDDNSLKYELIAYDENNVEHHMEILGGTCRFNIGGQTQLRLDINKTLKWVETKLLNNKS